VKQAKAVAAEKEQAEKEALNSKSDAEAAKTSLEVKLAAAKVDLSEKKTALANATSVKEQAQKEYDEVVEAITPLRNAQNDYKLKKTAEDTAKAEYQEAQDTVDKLSVALVDAVESQKNAEDRMERAKHLSYEDALVNEITDSDFAYLNDEIKNVKDADARISLLQAAYEDAVKKVTETKQTYEDAKTANAKASAELAVAQTTYDKYLAEKRAQDAIDKAKADEESKKANEMIRRVLKQKSSVDNYNDIIPTSVVKNSANDHADSVKTGDSANVAGLATAMGMAGIAVAASLEEKKRRKIKK